jgi:hypothetical protein
MAYHNKCLLFTHIMAQYGSGPPTIYNYATWNTCSPEQGRKWIEKGTLTPNYLGPEKTQCHFCS